MAPCPKAAQLAASSTAARALTDRPWKDLSQSNRCDNRNRKVSGFHLICKERESCFGLAFDESGSPLAFCVLQTNPTAPDLCHKLSENKPREALTHHNNCWNSLITESVKHGESRHALTVYQRIQHDASLHPTSYTFVALLKACSRLKDVERGRQIHADIGRQGMLETDDFIGSTLVDMYAKCGSLSKAQEIFDKLPVRDVVLWTALMTGYAEHGRGTDALHCFEQMQHEGVLPDAITFVATLKACGSIKATIKGRDIHAEIARKGFERDLFICSALVDMYAKCRLLAEAQEVFHKLPVRDAVLWTTLMAGYLEHGHGQEALDCFEQMQLEGISPGVVALVCSCKACGSIGSAHKGQEIHAEATQRGLEGDPVVGSTLVDMYAKCGSLAEAQVVFDKLRARDVVPWTALIAGYVEHGRGEEALDCFEQMQHEGISSDAVTFVCSLKACGSTGTTLKGRKIHTEIAKKGLEKELFASSTLVDMYAKCGSLGEAEKVFEKLPVQDVVSWTALITGYAQLGQSENVFYTFDRMKEKGIKPDLVTFASVLNACSQAGLVEKGQMYFEAFSNDYGLIPTLEHYNCIIDLLCRAGHINKAIAMIKKMPFHPGIVVWHTVLGACRKWGNVELGRHAFEHAVRLDEKDASAYVCMSNIYTDAAMLEEANKVEVMRVEKQAWE